MSALLVAGTTSDAGKTIVTTALCRAYARRGVKVAPFKAQNMSNNSMVCPTPDGRGAEIGRAQWIQAVAAGAEPEVAMNPVLLKPGGDRRSHVVVMGRPGGTIDSKDFVGGRTHLRDAAYDAFDDLSSRFDLVVVEGAGSPAEINLRAGDYVNMGLARHGAIPTVVVGDIDRGGVFAAMFGTVALLDAADQALVAGFVVNKFRGDVDLLRPGLAQLRELMPAAPREAVRAIGWLGDARLVPWLIERMEDVALARVAGEAFSTITGADLVALELEQPPPADLQTGPSDDPDDEDVALDDDENLPWPDPARVQRWWQARAGAFAAPRCFAGAAPTPAHLGQVLRTGTQRQRALAAQQRVLLQPGQACFNVAAPTWRQRRLLGLPGRGG